MNDFGLVSVLPAPFLASLALLTIAFGITVAARTTRLARLLLGGEVLLLALILYGTPALVEEVPRIGPMWRHLGVSDFIGETQEADGTIDAYFNFPGFFIFLAFLREITGLETLAGVAAWVSGLSNVVYSLPLFALYRFAFRDARLAWLGVWLFLCANWVGQDYLSPQGFGYFLYLTIVTVIAVGFQQPFRWASLVPGGPRGTNVTPIATAGADGGEDSDAASRQTPAGLLQVFSPRQRAALLAVVVVLFAAVAISHQLTPYAIALAVGALTILVAPSARSLTLVMGVIIFTWFTYVATPFLRRWLDNEFANFGEVQKNVSASLSERVGGSPQHDFVVQLRIGMTVLLWTLAVAGVILRLRRGHRDLLFLILAYVPILLVGLQRYGGEIGLRVYLFSLPGTIFFIVALMAPLLAVGKRRLFAPAVMGLSLILVCCFLFARYGNERLDHFTPEELAAVEHLYRIAPASRPATAQIVTLGPNGPYRWRHYASYSYEQISSFESWGRFKERETTAAPVVQELVTILRRYRHSYVLLSRSDEPFQEYLGGAPSDTYERLQRAIAGSSRLRALYVNRDAGIWALRSAGNST